MRKIVVTAVLAWLLAATAEAPAQRGRPGGGRPGGGEARDGGRPEGSRGGGDRAARLEGFLRSMDADGDGIIREDEVPPERLRMFRFMAERAGLDPSEGVPIDRVVEAMAGRGRGGGRDDGGRGQPADDARADTESPSRGEAADQQPAPGGPPLVPGFGSGRQPGTVPGFGTRIEPPPRVVLGGAGSTANQRRESTTERRRPAGTDRRGTRTREAEPDDRDQRRVATEERSRTSADSQQRASYRFLAPHERLPEGLPDWFIERDLNMDGQVSMDEFADEWTDEKVETFLRYDRNNDGIITVEEALNPLDEVPRIATEAGRAPREERAAEQSAESEPKPAESRSSTPFWLWDD